MQRLPNNMNKTITASKEWQAWKECNNFPLAPFKEQIEEAEKNDYFAPKHWRAFSAFIAKAQATSHKKLKMKINTYYKGKTNAN